MYLLLDQEFPIHVLEPWVGSQLLEIALGTQSLSSVSDEKLNTFNEIGGTLEMKSLASLLVSGLSGNRSSPSLINLNMMV